MINGGAIGQFAQAGNLDLAKNYAAQNSYPPQAYAPNAPVPPRTIASAISRMEGLNERLGQTRVRLDGIADMLGALRSAQAGSPSAKPPSIGAIGRLNDSADSAHLQLAEIEDLLAAIQNALG